MLVRDWALGRLYERPGTGAVTGARDRRVGRWLYQASYEVGLHNAMLLFKIYSDP